MQRIFDILFCSLALLVLFPLLLPVVVVLRLTGEGEVFFVQQRIGRGGAKFGLLKFATMLKNSPNIGTGTITVKDDARILPIGRALRRTKINELPQLINVLFGDMSIIGPRPMTDQTYGAYTLEVQRIVSQVRPGLSGIGSIVFRAEEDILAGSASSMDYYKKVIAPYKGALEKWYVAHQHIGTYFLAILMTIWVVLIPGSSLQWRVFRTLPEPPDELKAKLNWSS